MFIFEENFELRDHAHGPEVGDGGIEGNSHSYAYPVEFAQSLGTSKEKVLENFTQAKLKEMNDQILSGNLSIDKYPGDLQFTWLAWYARTIQIDGKKAKEWEDKRKEIDEENGPTFEQLRLSSTKEIGILNDEITAQSLGNGVSEKEEVGSKSIDIQAFQKKYPDAEALLNSQLGPSATVEDILMYQKEHSITEEDLGKQTYWELRARKSLDNIKKQDNLPHIIVELKTILPNLNGKTAHSIEVGDKILLFNGSSEFQKLVAADPEFSKMLVEYQKRQEDFVQSDEGAQVLENHKESIDSLYKTITNENLPWSDRIKKVASDPVVLMAGGLLFLFGVVGGKMKYTDSFMKRLGWVIGGATLGPALLKKLGIDDMIDDVKESAKDGVLNEGADAASKGFKKGREKVQAFFENKLPDVYNSISEALGGSFDKVTQLAGSYNDSLRDLEGDEGDNYIEDPKMEVLLGDLLGDNKFLNTSKEDLTQVNSITSLSDYISDDTGKLFTEAGIGDADIKSFIQHHLLEKRFEEGDLKVSDIFFTAQIKEKVNIFVLENLGNLVTGNSALDKEIKAGLSPFAHSSDSDLKNVGIQLATALKKGEIEEFSLDDFPSIEPEDRNKVETFINKVKAIFAGEQHIKEKVQEVDNINVHVSTGSGTSDDTSTLESKLNIINELNLADDKLQGSDNFSKSLFDDAKIAKKQEIFEAASALGIITLGGMQVATEVGRLEKETDQKNELSQMKELVSSIGDVPSIDNSISVFVSYIESNKDTFKIIEELAISEASTDVSHKANLETEANLAEAKLTEFKNNFEAKVQEFISDVEIESGKIEAINTSGSFKKAEFLQALEDIEKIEISTKDLVSEKDKNIFIEFLDNSGYINKYKQIANTLSILGETVDVTEIDINSNELVQKLLDKKRTIVEQYDMELSIIDDNFDLANVAGLRNLSQAIGSAAGALSLLDRDDSIEHEYNQKIDDLKNAISEIETKFKEEMLRADSDDLEDIKRSYDQNFKPLVNAGNIKESVKSYLFGDEVTKIYEERKEELEDIDEINQNEKENIDLNKARNEYLKKVTFSKENFEKHIGEAKTVTDTLSQKFPMQGDVLVNLLIPMLSNDDFSNNHSQIQNFLDWVYDTVDSKIKK